MSKVILLFLLAATLYGMEIAQNFEEAPHTYIGTYIVACIPTSWPMSTQGFVTSYSANTYACTDWNNKAKALPDCFVAINGVCGKRASDFCNRCVLITNNAGQRKKCRVIDLCEAQHCKFRDSGHLSILDNNGNENYKFMDKGKYLEPYPGSGEQPYVQWMWVPQC